MKFLEMIRKSGILKAGPQTNNSYVKLGYLPLLFSLVVSCNQAKPLRKQNKGNVTTVSDDLKRDELKFTPCTTLKFEYVLSDSVVKITEGDKGSIYTSLKGEVTNTGDSAIFYLGASCYGVISIFWIGSDELVSPVHPTNCNSSTPFIGTLPPGGKVRILELFNKNSLKGKERLGISLYTVDHSISDDKLMKHPEVIQEARNTDEQDLEIVWGKFSD